MYKTHEFHQTVRGWSGIGYNYFIEKDGTVVEGRGLYWSARERHNRHTIGICMTGNSINTSNSCTSECIIFFMQNVYEAICYKERKYTRS